MDVSVRNAGFFNALGGAVLLSVCLTVPCARAQEASTDVPRASSLSTLSKRLLGWLDATGASWLMPLLRLVAEDGDPAAQTVMGDKSISGESGIRKDYKEAMAWYRKAADQGFTPAMRSLAYELDEGNIVERDTEEAWRWYWQAAEMGDALALRIVGSRYGVARDAKEAYFWYILAVKRGNNDAMEARDVLASLLEPDEIASVRRRAMRWKPKEYQEYQEHSD